MYTYIIIHVHNYTYYNYYVQNNYYPQAAKIFQLSPEHGMAQSG